MGVCVCGEEVLGGACPAAAPAALPKSSKLSNCRGRAFCKPAWPHMGGGAAFKQVVPAARALSLSSPVSRTTPICKSGGPMGAAQPLNKLSLLSQYQNVPLCSAYSQPVLSCFSHSPHISALPPLSSPVLAIAARANVDSQRATGSTRVRTHPIPSQIEAATNARGVAEFCLT